MLRMESETGWWLITHPDHARLAGAFATHWGNELFPAPQPRASVLYGIHVHDDGWTARDAHPVITRAGKPSAFSHELVGSYSAFEEIDLADYLAVRESAVLQVEATDPYAALLVSMHTYSLLTEHADRSTIAAAQLPLLDAFLDRQRRRQENLRAAIRASPHHSAIDTTDEAILTNFHLLQATDNLSLLSCVAYMQPSTLLHDFPTSAGRAAGISVTPVAPRQFRLDPYPFNEPAFTCRIPARHIEGKLFADSGELAAKFAAAPIEELSIAISG
jgi:Protein of unknown function (DUF3891)